MFLGPLVKMIALYVGNPDPEKCNKKILAKIQFDTVTTGLVQSKDKLTASRKPKPPYQTGGIKYQINTFPFSSPDQMIHTTRSGYKSTVVLAIWIEG